MKKKTNKLIYVILGIAAILSAALIPFAALRRKQLLAEGDSDLADFCVKMGIFGVIALLVFSGIIFLLLLKDKRTAAYQNAFHQELAKTPLFERWLLNEEAYFKNRFRAYRTFIKFLTVPMIFIVILFLILLLDGIGETSDLFPYYVVVLLFSPFVIWFSWWLLDYRKQYMRSLLRSVSEQLPTHAEKDAFGEQLLRNGAGRFSYQAHPQSAASIFFASEDYAYFRQPYNCRIMKNRDMDRVTVKMASYTIGMRFHFRTCYVIELYIKGETKPAWRGYYHRQEELNHALGIFRKIGIPDERIENRLMK